MAHRLPNVQDTTLQTVGQRLSELLNSPFHSQSHEISTPSNQATMTIAISSSLF